MAAALAFGRGVHLAAVLSVFGTLVFRAVIAPPGLAGAPAATAARLERRLTSWVWYSFAAALLTAGVWLAEQTIDMAEAGSADEILAALRPVLLQTRFGHLLLLRLALLLTAAACFGGRRRGAWLAVATGLAGLSVVTQAAMGHAAAMGGAEGAGVASTEAMHLLAAGAWLGGLAPLCLAVASLPPAHAAAAARHFSPLGFACVVVLAASALVQGLELVGSVPALVGTAYGLIALGKLTGFCVLVGIAAQNRFVLTAALAGPAPDAAGRRLRFAVAGEAGLGLAVVLAAGVLASLSPGIHDQPDWPFPIRPSFAALPDAAARWQVAGALTALGVAILLLGASFPWRRRRWRVRGAALVLLGLGVVLVRPLLIDAYPTTFWRSPTGFAAGSIARGAKIFAANCTACHGPAGRGDGPQAHALPIPPADLTAPHFLGHSEGELFWFVSHGFAAPSGDLAMPGFAVVLSADERWNVVDFLVANNAGAAVAGTGAWPFPVPAPDFAATCADGRALVLNELRGQVVRILAETATATGPVSAGVPPEGVRTLLLVGNNFARPPPGTCVAFGSTIWNAYALIAGLPVEQFAGTVLLIDANGWLRLRLRSGDPQEAADIGRIAPSPISAGAASGGGHPHQH